MVGKGRRGSSGTTCFAWPTRVLALRGRRWRPSSGRCSWCVSPIMPTRVANLEWHRHVASMRPPLPTLFTKRGAFTDRERRAIRERYAPRPCASYQSTVLASPSSSDVVAFHPSPASRDTSISLLGVPSVCSRRTRAPPRSPPPGTARQNRPTHEAPANVVPWHRPGSHQRLRASTVSLPRWRLTSRST